MPVLGINHSNDAARWMGARWLGARDIVSALWPGLSAPGTIARSLDPHFCTIFSTQRTQRTFSEDREISVRPLRKSTTCT
jgi:hypothetical protein